jgi:hypothetical protein
MYHFRFGDPKDNLIVMMGCVTVIEPRWDEKSHLDSLEYAARHHGANSISPEETWIHEPAVVELERGLVRGPAVFFRKRLNQGPRPATTFAWVIIEGKWMLMLMVLVWPEAPAHWEHLPTTIVESVTFGGAPS